MTARTPPPREHVLEVRRGPSGPWFLFAFYASRPAALAAIGPLVRKHGADGVRLRAVDDSRRTA